jgi:hypothetical protein
MKRHTIYPIIAYIVHLSVMENAHNTVGIPPKMVADNQLKEADSIKIIAEPSPDGTKTFTKAISREA